MNSLAASLARYVERHFVQSLQQEQGDPVRPVLVGPPPEALRGLFDLLTANGTQDWRLTVNGSAYPVALLLVDGQAAVTMNAGVLATRCHWDYAVTIRNSYPHVLILTEPATWDNRPESLANTTETLGSPRPALKGDGASLWQHLVREISVARTLGERDIKATLTEVFRQAGSLEPAVRDPEIWSVVDSLLGPPPGGLQALDAMCFAAGFPATAPANPLLQDSVQVLDDIAVFLRDYGLRDGVDRLKGTTVAQTDQLGAGLDALRDWLASRVSSAAALTASPARFFRHPSPPPGWYVELHTGRLKQMLDELQQRQPQQKLALTCSNPFVGVGPLPGGPWVVATTPDLRAQALRGAVVVSPTFTRRVDRGAATLVPADANDPLLCNDAAVPSHRAPVKYTVTAPGFRPATADVLVLDSFAGRGLAYARDAIRNPEPTAKAGSTAWTQILTLPRGGATEIRIYHGSGIAEVELRPTSGAPIRRASLGAAQYAPITVDIERDEQFVVSLFDAAGTAVGSWELTVVVQETTEHTSSRFEALVHEHRTDRATTPMPADTPLQRLETTSYLPQGESWRPVFACWPGAIGGSQQVDWATRQLGTITPQIDPRRQINPPPPLLAAREAVRQYLLATQQPVSEVDLAAPAFWPLVTTYLNEYLAWFQASPADACWQDTISIHAADWNEQAAHHVASDEPVVVLLSPLHPLRLAWHAVAQKYLQDAAADHCPAAGLLDPSACPDCGILHLWNGQAVVPRAFFSLTCDHVHWAALLNTGYLDDGTSRTEVIKRLTELGLSIQGITGGFTSQLTLDSMHEVNRLLPARGILRVGVVGSAETSDACAEGVIDWCAEQFDNDSEVALGCSAVEVYDTRGAETPSPEQLAALSESTDERARWYRLAQDAKIPLLDLTIIDQLGARSPTGASGQTRSPMAPSALYRVRIREDFQGGRALAESRVGATTTNGTGLADLLARAVAAYESQAAADQSKTHFTFRPNQDAIGRRLSTSTFLSLTSSQIDPACIVRGTVGQGGYLWDYELPGVLGGSKSNLGYYLVANPTGAMCEAARRSASLVTTAQLDPRKLLDEISRHGIPVLKRLAGGGSQSRGELGLLLAVRLLQDAFRAAPVPPRLPVCTGRCIHLVLPVDPYEELFGKIREKLPGVSQSAKRPDLLVVAIDLGTSETVPVNIKLTPVEVKFRAASMSATDMADALRQARNLGEIAAAIWSQPLANTLWETCAAALLAQILDFGFRIYASPDVHGQTEQGWAKAHQRVLQDVLDRKAQLTVNVAGRLLVFHAGGSSQVVDLDGDTRLDTAVVSPADAGVLLSDAGVLSPTAAGAVAALDFSYPVCTCTGGGAAVPPPATATVTVATGAATTCSLPPPTPPAAPTSSPPATPQSNTIATAGPAPTGAQPPAPVPATPTPANAPQRGQSRVPQEVRQQVRGAFEGFVGNHSAVERLGNDLLRALIEQPPHLSKNYLFTGLPSTGKTELARRMAVALGLPFVKLDGRGVTTRDRLFQLVNGELQNHGLSPSQTGQQVGLPVLEYPPLVVFIDEVHLVPRGIQEALLTMLEAADRTVVLSDQVARVQKATFLFATTRASDVDAAFASRCDEIQLQEYSEQEVAQILQRRVPHDWPDEAYRLIAKLGRCVPRVAIQLAQALETAILVAETEKTPTQHLEDVRRAREIDELGLTRLDMAYLSLLEGANRPLGEQVVQNMLRTVDKDRIVNEVEPFLARLGFIRHGAQGREITAQGREYVLARRMGA